MRERPSSGRFHCSQRKPFDAEARIFSGAFTEASTSCMVPSMESPFLTIAEAIEQTGRSGSTVRRLIKTITDNDAHADRDAVEPSAKKVAAYKKKGESFTWTIREDVLLRNFGSAPVKEKKYVSKTETDIFSILQKELSLKNAQIEKQWEVIHALNDRLREGNILMGSLQKRLGPPQNESPATDIVEASTVAPSMQASMEPSTKKRRGLFGWMRG